MSETSIDFTRDDKYIYYFSNDYSEMKYMGTLLGYEDVSVVFDYSGNEGGGGLELKIPKKWYRRPKPPATRVMTEEQKQAGAERLRKAREVKNG